MPARGIQHVDLAVGDVERSLTFYYGVLGTARAQGEVPQPHVSTDGRGHLPQVRRAGFGLRPADGGVHRHYEVGIEHLAFEVDDRAEVDEAYQRCVSAGGKIQSPPEEHYIDDGEDYYAFFAFDPDGIEVFCWPSSPYR